MTSESTALAREAGSPPAPIRGRIALLGFLAILVGVASALNALSETPPRDLPLAYATILQWVLAGAALATALILGVDGLIRKAARALAPNARQRFLRLDLLTWAVLLAVFVGAAGIHVNATIVTVLVLALTALKALALYVSLDRPQRDQAFSSLGYLAFLFLISGFAALIYQIVWQRTLFAAFGVNIESITIIVSLFMFGLGLGSVAGGLISRRFPNRAPLLFLTCEVGIGCFGIVSIPLIKATARLALHGSLVQVAAAIFALLCFPTMLMGATLPILVAHLYRHYRNVGKSVGLLYCINTLGSAIACFITADVLFVLLGQQAAVFTAAGCNLIVGILVWRYGRRIPNDGQAPAAAQPRPPGQANGISPRFLLVLFFAAATGYISLSQEMLWMRAVSYVTGGHPAVFAHVLGCFLIGVALGAFAGDKFCEGISAKPGAAPLRFIAGALLLCGVFYYPSIAATAALYTWSQFAGAAAVYLAVAAVSFTLGSVFPVLCHYGTTSTSAVGLSVSRIYVANIVGATLGPLLTGFVLMDRFTTDQLVLQLSLATLVCAAIAIIASRHLRVLLLFPAIVWPMLADHRAIYHDLLEKLHYQTAYQPILHYRHLVENRSGIIAVAEDYSGPADILYGGAIYDGTFNIDPWLDSNGISRAYMLAGLHPNPVDILEIGLASGSWSRVMSSYGPVRHVTSIEINPGYLTLIAGYPEQATVLRDPRHDIHIDDGRRWLNRNPDRKFDFILQNTTFHWRSHATDLLSVEYFDLTKRHLKPGGVVFVNTTAADEVAYTLAHVFRHAVRVGVNELVAASDEPFSIPPAQIRANLMQFRFDGTPMFADPPYSGVADRLAMRDLHDVAREIRARRDLRLITDDNMATEFKRAGWVTPARHWQALFETIH